MALRWLFNSAFTRALVHSPDEKHQNNRQNKEGKIAQKLDSQTQRGTARSFQVPLHYPRFMKIDYEKMEEWKIDMLLREYGLENHIKGTLDEKRMFAMGTFLWPDQL
uniref:DUF7722 domain-containing protein n=1 Tax=Opuntia streptacantha TaxID=393608 RepID=A0A7C9CKM0_OPUST